jgi:hypothetical protein
VENIRSYYDMLQWMAADSKMIAEETTASVD